MYKRAIKFFRAAFSILLATVFMLTFVACGNETNSGNSGNGNNNGDGQNTDVTYTVTFNLNYTGAPKAETQTVKSGEKVTKPTDPVRDGYTFGNWYSDSRCTTEFDFGTAITRNTVLYAGWSSNSATVTFNYNYVGAPAMTTQTVAIGQTATEPAAPERPDYSFTGWYTEAACENKFEFTTPVSANLTLYAGWTLTSATVTFDLGYEAEEQIPAQKVEIGKTATEPTAPAREAYDFGGWYTEAACTTRYDFGTAVRDNLTLYAKWTLKTYTVTFVWGYDNKENTTAKVEHGKTVDEPENPRSGFDCIWQCEGEDYDFGSPVTSDLTLTAKWEAVSTDTYSVTFHWNTNTGEDIYTVQQIKRNNRATVPAEPVREGYYFEGWYASSECSGSTFNFNSRITSSVNLYAHWLKQYTFEAEYTDLDGKAGAGYSSNMSGTGLIVKDRDGSAEASGGYYVTNMYYNGAFLQFDIESSAEVTDAVVIIRIQCEFFDMTFNPDLYSVTVNGAAMSYREVSFTADTQKDVQTQGGGNRRPFENVIMTTRAHLIKGKNEICLTVINGITHPQGTMHGDAPMVDCIYVCTDKSDLTWTPKTKNIEGIA